MERYFIFVTENFEIANTLDEIRKEFSLLKDYQRLIFESSRIPNSANLPLNLCSIKWAVCGLQNQLVCKGVGNDEFQNFLVNNPRTGMLGAECWDLKSFRSLNNHAIDIFLFTGDSCSEFCKSFNPSNSVKVFGPEDNTEVLNHQLFWRGTIRMKDPLNSSNFRLIEHAELSYAFDKLDLLVDQISNTSQPTVHDSQRMFNFCPYLELVSAFEANLVPLIFYSSTYLTLDIRAESFWNCMNEKVSLLLRLDYSTENVDQWEKEVGTQSIHYLSHWCEGELRLYVLKNVEQVQNMANLFVTLRSTEVARRNMNTCSGTIELLQIDRNEKEIRRLQLIALQTWINEKGSIDEKLMETLLGQVARSFIASKSNECKPMNFPEMSYGRSLTEDVLKWKLERKNVEVERPSDNRLLQPNGQTVTVDINHILRCFSKNVQTRSPKKLQTENRHLGSTQLKPTTDLSTVLAAEWPQCAQLKYHGINYNLSVADEKAEKQQAEYRDKLIGMDIASATWCNPWSFYTSSVFQLSSNYPRPVEVRTPRKNPPRNNLLLRKSPRLLAKNEPRPRRTPSKKNTAAPPNRESFKQQLKAVIIKVLGDHKINTKDPLFRTCANKLSVICMALLKDSKSTASSRQMYQVAKSHAKQVVQFIKQ